MSPSLHIRPVRANSSSVVLPVLPRFAVASRVESGQADAAELLHHAVRAEDQDLVSGGVAQVAAEMRAVARMAPKRPLHRRLKDYAEQLEDSAGIADAYVVALHLKGETDAKPGRFALGCLLMGWAARLDVLVSVASRGAEQGDEQEEDAMPESGTRSTLTVELRLIGGGR